MIRGTVGPLLLQQGPNKRQIRGDSPSSPGRSGAGAHCRDLRGLETPPGVGCQIERRGHRQREGGVRPETAETRVTDSLTLWGLTEERDPEFSAPPGRRLGGRHFHSPPPKLYGKLAGNKSSREQTRADYLARTGQGRGNSASGKDIWEPRQQAPPPEDQREQPAKTKFTDQ